MVYLKATKGVNTGSSHHKEKQLFGGVYMRLWMLTYCDNHFAIHISHYAICLKLYSTVYKLYFDKTKKKKDVFV